MNKSDQSSAFYLLHPTIQRWIWQQGWQALRDIQEAAIKPILNKDTDIIISASTAGGKTEAAFLPIFSDAISISEQEGIHTLGIIPLKALINDQFRRLSFLGESTGVKVTPWHGDISQSVKMNLLKKAEGILLITPESLESLLINKGVYAQNLLRNLSFIVIDELHAFIGTERGKQLQSLMSRIDIYTQKSPSRIGLSATLGDMDMAYQFMRPSCTKNYKLIESKGYRHALKILVKGYLRNNDEHSVQEENNSNPSDQIGDYLYSNLRGSTNLVFANSRSAVEELSCYLREKSENEYVPNEFFPHHGSLSKELRQELEARMHKGKLPTTTVCTNTLELGIDIGSVDSVAQIDAPPSVSSLRQRLGRSGRKVDAASVLRMFCVESEIDKNSSLTDKLRLNLFFVIAIVELLIEGWYEPPEINKLHLSTLIQQIIALIAQYGGISPKRLWQLLCKNGAFNNFSSELFQKLLIQLGKEQVIQQDHDGTIVLGGLGEKLVNDYTFYAAFNTIEEYIFQYNDKTIASLPLLAPLNEDERIILAGRKWKVLHTDIKRKLVSIVPAQGGGAKFTGNGGVFVSDRVAQRVRQEYLNKCQLQYLDRQAVELYNEGIEYFNDTSLTNVNFYVSGNSIYIFPWFGSQVCQTLLAELNYLYGIKAFAGEPFLYIECKTTLENLFDVVSKIIRKPSVNALKLAEQIKYKQVEKFDNLLSDELLCHEYSIRWLDTEKTHIFWNKLYQQIYLNLNN
ncbi:MAG: DEAD/DEAH box helicase [Victivallaceae bacterium]